MEKMTPRKYQSPILNQVLKGIPLDIRIRQLLQMDYLDIVVPPSESITDQEELNAYNWANKLTDQIIEEIVKWEIDGRPKRDKK